MNAWGAKGKAAAVLAASKTVEPNPATTVKAATVIKTVVKPGVVARVESEAPTTKPLNVNANAWGGAKRKSAAVLAPRITGIV